MAEKISMRLQTPPDENGKRKDIHLVTSAEEVIVSEGVSLSDKLNQIASIQIQENKPTFPCIWAKLIK